MFRHVIDEMYQVYHNILFVHDFAMFSCLWVPVYSAMSLMEQSQQSTPAHPYGAVNADLSAVIDNQQDIDDGLMRRGGGARDLPQPT